MMRMQYSKVIYNNKIVISDIDIRNYYIVTIMLLAAQIDV
jgi:hypothetical protein